MLKNFKKELQRRAAAQRVRRPASQPLQQPVAQRSAVVRTAAPIPQVIEPTIAEEAPTVALTKLTATDEGGIITVQGSATLKGFDISGYIRVSSGSTLTLVDCLVHDSPKWPVIYVGLDATLILDGNTKVDGNITLDGRAMITKDGVMMRQGHLTRLGKAIVTGNISQLE